MTHEAPIASWTSDREPLLMQRKASFGQKEVRGEATTEGKDNQLKKPGRGINHRAHHQKS